MLRWILISIILILIILGLVLAIGVFKNKAKKKRKENYYSLFIMGAIWVPFGIMMMLMSDSFIGELFFILGWIYFVIGIIHKDEWDKKKGPYLIQNEKLRWLVVAILGLLFLIGFIVLYFVKA